MPDRPEHHYRYDPAKAEAYTATTLAWVGDPAAERFARHVLARLESPTDGPPRYRRAAACCAGTQKRPLPHRFGALHVGDSSRPLAASSVHASFADDTTKAALLSELDGYMASQTVG
jgi:hypothetical protein